MQVMVSDNQPGRLHPCHKILLWKDRVAGATFSTAISPESACCKDTGARLPLERVRGRRYFPLLFHQEHETGAVFCIHLRDGVPRWSECELLPCLQELPFQMAFHPPPSLSRSTQLKEVRTQRDVLAASQPPHNFHPWSSTGSMYTAGQSRYVVPRFQPTFGGLHVRRTVPIATVRSDPYDFSLEGGDVSPTSAGARSIGAARRLFPHRLPLQPDSHGRVASRSQKNQCVGEPAASLKVLPCIRSLNPYRAQWRPSERQWRRARLPARSRGRRSRELRRKAWKSWCKPGWSR